MSDLRRGPAYRIETQRLLLRCYDPRDAPLLKAAIDASLEHLRPFAPWVRDEPQPLDAKVELLRHFRAQFDLGQDFVFGIFDRAEAELLGSAGLHARGDEDAREIGYWIAARHTRSGLATEAAAALVRVGFEVEDLERLEIHCDPANEPSACVARKLGFRHDATLRARSRGGPGPSRDRMVWSMLREELETSLCARAQVRAFDALGRAILEPRPEGEPRGRSAFR